MTIEKNDELDLYRAVSTCRRLVITEGVPVQAAARAACMSLPVSPAEVARLAIVALSAARAAAGAMTQELLAGDDEPKPGPQATT